MSGVFISYFLSWSCLSLRIIYSPEVGCCRVNSNLCSIFFDCRMRRRVKGCDGLNDDFTTDMSYYNTSLEYELDIVGHDSVVG